MLPTPAVCPWACLFVAQAVYDGGVVAVGGVTQSQLSLLQKGGLTKAAGSQARAGEQSGVR